MSGPITWDAGQFTWDSGFVLWSNQYPNVNGTCSSGQAESIHLDEATPNDGKVQTGEAETLFIGALTTIGIARTGQGETFGAHVPKSGPITWDSGQITWDSGFVLWSNQYPLVKSDFSSGQAETIGGALFVPVAFIVATGSTAEAQSLHLDGASRINGTAQTGEAQSLFVGALTHIGSARTGQGETFGAGGSQTVFGHLATAEAELSLGAADQWTPSTDMGKYAVVGGFKDGQAAAALTMRATYLGATLDRTLWITKSKTGQAGQEGAAAINMMINKAAMMVMCYAEGTPVYPDFPTENGTLTVLSGTTDVTLGCILSAQGVGCTGILNTARNTPLMGFPAGYYQLTGLTADTASLTLTALYGGFLYHAVVSIAKAKGGYEIATALPTTNLFDGRMVFLTTDGKLYQAFDGVFSAAVKAVDIEGMLTSDQIAGLDAAKLTGGIKQTQITDLKITTPDLDVGAVHAANLFAGAVTTAAMTADTIDGKVLRIGSANANVLTAGTMTADRFNAGIIITASAQITDGVVVSAKIGNLQVKTANIDDLTVGTTKIADFATSRITFVVQGSDARSVTVGMTPDSAASNILISWKAKITNYGWTIVSTKPNVYIYNYAVGLTRVLSGVSLLLDGNGMSGTNGSTPIYTGTVIDTSQSGAYRTYTLAAPDVGTVMAGSLIIIQEIKK